MSTNHQASETVLRPSRARLGYCAFCDRDVRGFCDDVLACREKHAASLPDTPENPARGVVVGLVGGAVLWGLLLLTAYWIGVF